MTENIEILPDGRLFVLNNNFMARIAYSRCLINSKGEESSASSYFAEFSARYGELLGADEVCFYDVFKETKHCILVSEIRALPEHTLNYSFISGVIMSPESWSIACIKYAETS